MTTLQDLTDYATPLSDNQMDIRTEYLEPISQTTHKFTFRLDQAGYLDENSMLVFKLKSTGGHVSRVNAFNGALGAINRVIFQVGDNIMNDVQEVYKYATLKNMNAPPDQRNKYFGHYLGNQLYTKAVESATDAPANGVQAAPQAYATEDDKAHVGTIVVDESRSGIGLGKHDDGTGAFVASHQLSDNAANNPQYGIPLGMLIPALKGQKIPLFLFQQQRILLTFEFNTADKYINQLSGNVGYAGGESGTAAAGDVTPADVRMVVDYIIMPADAQAEIMEQTNKEGGYRLEFYDVVNVQKNISAPPNGNFEVEHRIGQNGREVHNIIMWKETDKAGYGLGGNHRGYGLLGAQGCLGFDQEEYNCNIDGRDEFPDYKYNPVSQYNEVSEVLNTDLKVDRPMYCNDPNTESTLLATANSGLLGTMKPLCLSLRNGSPGLVGAGRVIGNYPIIWKYKRKVNGTEAQNSRANNVETKVNYFIEVSRVANIRNTAKGMNVIVSY